MTKNRYQTTKRKKALSNQSFNSELKMTAIKFNSTHTAKGMSIRDNDNSKLFNLRQSNACGNNTNTIIEWYLYDYIARHVYECISSDSGEHYPVSWLAHLCIQEIAMTGWLASATFSNHRIE